MLAGFTFEVVAKVRMREEDYRLAPLGNELPLRLTVPNSVTTYIMSLRGAVAMFPVVRLSTTRLLRTPARSYVDDIDMNDLPPFDAYAPRTNATDDGLEGAPSIAQLVEALRR